MQNVSSHKRRARTQSTARGQEIGAHPCDIVAPSSKFTRREERRREMGIQGATMCRISYPHAAGAMGRRMGACGGGNLRGGGAVPHTGSRVRLPRRSPCLPMPYSSAGDGGAVTVTPGAPDDRGSVSTCTEGEEDAVGVRSDGLGEAAVAGPTEDPFRFPGNDFLTGGGDDGPIGNQAEAIVKGSSTAAVLERSLNPDGGAGDLDYLQELIAIQSGGPKAIGGGFTFFSRRTGYNPVQARAVCTRAIRSVASPRVRADPVLLRAAVQAATFQRLHVVARQAVKCPEPDVAAVTFESPSLSSAASVQRSRMCACVSCPTPAAAAVFPRGCKANCLHPELKPPNIHQPLTPDP